MFGIGGFLDSLDSAAKDTLEAADDEKRPSATWIRSQRKGGSTNNMSTAASSASTGDDHSGFAIPQSDPGTNTMHSTSPIFR